MSKDDKNLPATQPRPNIGLTLLDEAGFARAMRLAEMMAEAKGLPGFFNRSPGTCLAAIEDGLRLGISPFVVARMAYQVHPSAPLGYLGKFVTAIINGSPDVLGTLSFEHYGDWKKVQGKQITKLSTRKQDEHGNPAKYRVPGWKDEDEVGLGVTVRGTLRDGVELKELHLDMVQCHPRNSTLWGSDPAQQICYVAARRWADRHAPHILMGIHVAEEMSSEMIDVTPEAKAPAPGSGSRLNDLIAKLKPAEHDADGVVQDEPPADTLQELEAAGEPLSAPAEDMVTLAFPGPARRAVTLSLDEARQQINQFAGRAQKKKGAKWCQAALELNPWLDDLAPELKAFLVQKGLECMQDEDKAEAEASADLLET